MKITCNVEINDRSQFQTTVCMRKAHRAQRACLTIGRASVKTNDLYLLLQTTQNMQGVKYKADGNVERIFTKYIEEGKVTICLLQPPLDLCIRCDAIQLKSFVRVLKSVLAKKLHPCISNVSNLNPKSIKPAPKTKIVVKKRSDYPVLQGFPRTTEELHLSGLERKSFDRQILRLQSLRILDLSYNHLSYLPKELGSLPNLMQLIVTCNPLGKGSPSKWAWMSGEGVSKNLRLLDISFNELNSLPEQIGKLRALVTLNASQNLLTHLPQSIGNLTKLKYLDVSSNLIRYLPGSLMSLRLNRLDLSGNIFDEEETSDCCKIAFPHLVEIAARAVLAYSKPYDASTIPGTLVAYLARAKYCVCGGACFECYSRRLTRTSFTNFATDIIVSNLGNSRSLPYDCYYCSERCLRRYSKR